MSKIGKLPVAIPAGVTVTVANNVVTVKGPKGELKQDFASACTSASEKTSETVFW